MMSRLCLASMTSEEIEQSLLRAGFEPDEIPALLGNIDVETGGTFDFRQIENTTKEQKGYGLFQFTGGHLTSYLDYLEDTQQEDSADAQTKFVYANIYDKEPPHVIGAGNQRKIQEAFDDVFRYSLIMGLKFPWQMIAATLVTIGLRIYRTVLDDEGYKGMTNSIKNNFDSNSLAFTSIEI